MNDSWIDGGGARTGAAMRLYCFAHAGGGPAFFRPWREPMLPEIEVAPIALPGRGARWREQPYTRMEALAESLCEILLEHCDRPFAFFGHSLGAAVAYEVARRLATTGHEGLLRLFVSARHAPHMPARRSPMRALPEEELLVRLRGLDGIPEEVLREGELLRAFLPMLRADFEINETYTPTRGPLLTVPLSALAASEDPEVVPAEMRAWADVTSAEFTLRVFRGGHFYLNDDRPRVLAAIREDLKRSRPPSLAVDGDGS